MRRKTLFQYDGFLFRRSTTGQVTLILIPADLWVAQEVRSGITKVGVPTIRNARALRSSVVSKRAPEKGVQESSRSDSQVTAHQDLIDVETWGSIRGRK
ncbi:hypothetical protein ALC62_02659 [Cyphomyrmex costatus]|uniref:Uncharacterized protein n=1 Tax=Cyphomyrmex costatus TaxID=456900 RepID=A0A195D0C5_9HYME|nr:hypothetical protein ALC62_02659 [Cyphomyrmex costatus]